VHHQDEAEAGHAPLRPQSRFSQRRTGSSQSTRSLLPRVSTDRLPVFGHCARQQAQRSGWEAFMQLQVPIMAGVTANPAVPVDRLTGLVSPSQTIVAGAVVIHLLTCSGVQAASSCDRGSRVECCPKLGSNQALVVWWPNASPKCGGRPNWAGWATLPCVLVVHHRPIPPQSIIGPPATNFFSQFASRFRGTATPPRPSK